MGPEIAVGDFT